MCPAMKTAIRFTRNATDELGIKAHRNMLHARLTKRVKQNIVVLLLSAKFFNVHSAAYLLSCHQGQTQASKPSHAVLPNHQYFPASFQQSADGNQVHS